MKHLLVTLLLCLFMSNAHADTYYQWVDSADIYISQEQWLKAENALLNALRTEPANAQNSLLLSNLGTVQRYCGKYQEALDTYTMALFMTPRSTTLIRNRAALYAEMDSLDLACADYSHLIILDDTDEDALYNRALIYMQKGDTTACRKDLEYMLSNNPNSSKARMGFATFFKAQGYYSEAIEMYNQVIRENDRVADLYIGRAETYILWDKSLEADKDIARALELAPNDPFVYILRAYNKIARYEYADAVRDVERARELGYNPTTCDNLINEIMK